jgi:hypothetical protein
MTAAIALVWRPSLRASLGGGTTRVLTVLALVLPIPLCAALGLSLPLPATVTRIAAKLVPFANSAVLDTRGEQVLGARGSIVRYQGELTRFGGGGVPGGKVDGSRTARPNGTATTIPAAGEHGSSGPRQIDPKAGLTSPSGPAAAPVTGSIPPQGGTTPPQGGSTPPRGGGNPVPPSAPPTVADTATAAAAAVVGTVTATATTATSTVVATAAPAVGVVTGVVAPVLPPKP